MVFEITCVVLPMCHAFHVPPSFAQILSFYPHLMDWINCDTVLCISWIELTVTLYCAFHGPLRYAWILVLYYSIVPYIIHPCSRAFQVPPWYAQIIPTNCSILIYINHTPVLYISWGYMICVVCSMYCFMHTSNYGNVWIRCTNANRTIVWS